MPPCGFGVFCAFRGCQHEHAHDKAISVAAHVAADLYVEEFYALLDCFYERFGADVVAGIRTVEDHVLSRQHLPDARLRADADFYVQRQCALSLLRSHAEDPALEVAIRSALLGVDKGHIAQRNLRALRRTAQVDMSRIVETKTVTDTPLTTTESDAFECSFCFETLTTSSDVRTLKHKERNTCCGLYCLECVERMGCQETCPRCALPADKWITLWL